MIWMLSIPVIMYLTFSDIITIFSPHSFLTWVFVIAVSLLISALVSIVPLSIAAFIGSRPKIHGIRDAEYPLIALREKAGTHGNFFLGSGAINDQQYYFWYRRELGDSISGGKTAREPGVKIYERDSYPVMVTYKTAYKNKWSKYIWLVGLDLRDTEWCDAFYIPKGSILEGYSL